jgi:hypothetical protein
MEDIDLNIDNYNLEDILNLFNISYNFNEEDLKNAKKIVLHSHPDKSKLDKKYFFFFTKAYKYLYFIYEFRKKNNIKEDLSKEEKEYVNIITEEERNNNYESLKNNNDFKNNFNSWFNKMFDEHKISSEYEKDGYGEWLKDDSNFKEFDNCNNISKMNESINNYKNNNFSVVKYNDFDDSLFSSNNSSNLLNDRLDDYSNGDIFSKFGYNDLKKAHEESLIPVSDNLKRQDFKSINDYKMFRNEQEGSNIQYTLDESNKILENNKKIQDKITNDRAFKLAKQDEEVMKNNNNFWSKIKLLNMN